MPRCSTATTTGECNFDDDHAIEDFHDHALPATFATSACCPGTSGDSPATARRPSATPHCTISYSTRAADQRD